MAAAEQEEGNKNAATWELVPTSEQQEPERFLSGTPIVPGYCVKVPVLLLPPKRLSFGSDTKVRLHGFPPHSGPHCPRWFLVVLRPPYQQNKLTTTSADHRRPSAVVPDRI